MLKPRSTRRRRWGYERAKDKILAQDCIDAYRQKQFRPAKPRNQKDVKPLKPAAIAYYEQRLDALLDLETGRIVWVGHGRGQAALGKFWRRLRLSRAKIQAVAMDMSGAYWAAVLEHLPGAAVVFDRFHIMKLMNEKLDELRRVLVREATGAMGQTIKGTRYLWLTRAANLEQEKLPKLEDALKLNHPLSQAYYLKEELGLLWEQPSRVAMEDFLRQWCARAMETGIALLRQMAKTLLLHASGILSWWEHRLSSGKMEGVNNKIKTLTRQAYGYRDEAFFILKLLALHQARIKLLG